MEENENEVQPASETIVGADVNIKGNLRSPSDISIFGQVNGQVDSDTNVLVGEGSKIEGGVKGNRIVVSGKIVGNVEAGEHLEITSTGELKGDIKTADLVIQSGAAFLGKCEMASGGGEGNEEKAQDSGKESDEEMEEADEALEELEETIEE